MYLHVVEGEVLKLFAYTMAMFGLAYIVGHSTISLPFRMAVDPGPAGSDPRTTPPSVAKNFGDALRHWALALIECAACFGTWTGFIYGAWLQTDFGFSGPNRWVNAGVLALYTCSTNFLLSKLGGLILEGDSNGRN